MKIKDITYATSVIYFSNPFEGGFALYAPLAHSDAVCQAEFEVSSSTYPAVVHVRNYPWIQSVGEVSFCTLAGGVISVLANLVSFPSWLPVRPTSSMISISGTMT